MERVTAWALLAGLHTLYPSDLTDAEWEALQPSPDRWGIFSLWHRSCDWWGGCWRNNCADDANTAAFRYPGRCAWLRTLVTLACVTGRPSPLSRNIGVYADRR